MPPPTSECYLCDKPADYTIRAKAGEAVKRDGQVVRIDLPVDVGLCADHFATVHKLSWREWIAYLRDCERERWSGTQGQLW